MTAKDWFRDRPHLIGVGVEKCGTSSFDGWLRRSRAVAMPTVKETFALSRRWNESLETYREFYPRRWNGPIADITPSYFRESEVLDRLAALPSQVTVLLFLRHPVQRAWSAYLHTIDRQTVRGEGPLMPIDGAGGFPFQALYEQRAEYYFTTYAPIVKDLHARFGKERVVTLLLDDLIADPDASLMQIGETSGIDLSDLAGRPLPRMNSTRLPCITGDDEALRLWRDGLPHSTLKGDAAEAMWMMAMSWTRSVTEETCRAIHEEIFEDDTRELEELLGRPLPQWRRQKGLTARPIQPLSLEAGRRFVSTLPEKLRQKRLRAARLIPPRRPQ